MKKINVAIDGFSSCGKSTMAKELARKVGYIYIDSGAMYRAVALFCLKKGWITEQSIDLKSIKEQIHNLQISFLPDKEGNSHTYLNGNDVEKEIRSLQIAELASRISSLAFVRTQLVLQQKLMGQNKGVVMDGRDIGTVVFPDAELKIFLTASAEIRAQRRVDELIAKGENVSYNEVLKSVIERDSRDQNREESPLRKAPDAIVIDNSVLSKEEQNDILMKCFNEKIEYSDVY